MTRFLPWPHTMRSRLLVAALFIEAFMLTMLVGNSLRLLHGSLSEQAQNHAEQVAPVLNAALVAPLAQLDTATVQAILKESHAVEGIDYLAVLDSHGNLVATSGWNPERPLPRPDRAFSLENKEGGARFDVRTPIVLAGQELGQLQIGLDLDHIIAARRTLVLQGVGIAVGELVLSAALLTLAGWWLTRHLTRLTEAAGAMAQGDAAFAAVSEGQDEVGRLGAAFNLMSRAVSERMGDLKAALAERAVVAATLDQERARLLSLLSAMEFGVLFADEDGRVIYANPAFTGLWPQTGPVLGRSVGVAVPVSDLLAGGEAELANGRIITSSVFPVTGADDHGGTLWTFADVTASRLFARELLSAKAAAEAAADAKAAFLATMSHEIRTPMNGVIGMAGLLLDSPLDSRQKRHADAIRLSAEALLVILNDILDFSKLDSGKLIVEEHAFEVRPLVESVVDILAPRLSGRDLRLDCHIGPDSDGIFLSDSGRLRQVLLNLISNALKFTEHGTVTVTALITAAADGREWLRVTVADTGIGIAAEAQAHLFESFNQADSSTARRFGGTGLGLAISKRIVAMMGGEIGFSSRQGDGSSFWFQVPVTRSSERRAIPRESVLAPGGRLLVVSEDPDFLAPVASMLDRLGVEAELLPEATAALARLRQDVSAGRRPPPILLLDDRLSGVTAHDLALLTRADPALRAVSLVLAGETGGSGGGERTAASGIRHVLTWPLEPAPLFEMLARLGGTIPADLPPIPEKGSGMRILVAEDNAINQQVAVGLLHKFGHRADVADDGVAAVAMMEGCTYDLVLMDMQMPAMSGLDATRAIRAMAGPAASVPIIAMTANAMRGDREQCLAAGMNDYISKPIDRNKLVALLERWRPRIQTARARFERAG